MIAHSTGQKANVNPFLWTQEIPSRAYWSENSITDKEKAPIHDDYTTASRGSDDVSATKSNIGEVGI